MADQTNNPGTNPNRGTQNPGQTGDPGNRDKGNESGRQGTGGTGGERERGTVQEPGTGGGTQPNRDKQGDGFGSQGNPGDRGRTGM